MYIFIYPINGIKDEIENILTLTSKYNKKFEYLYIAHAVYVKWIVLVQGLGTVVTTPIKNNY